MTSKASFFQSLTNKWFNELSTQTLSSTLTQQINEIKDITILNNINFNMAKFHFILALRERCNPNKLKRYIKLSYNECNKAIKSNIIESYDKIVVYSLLISNGFIYHSNYGNNYIDGLKHIYNVLIKMNNDMKLRSDLQFALRSIIFWTSSERKLIKSVIYFAVRTNILIQTVQKHLNIASSNHNLPTYYDGYYFGRFKYPILCIKDFRNIMHSMSFPHRIQIDDIIIHTNNLYDTALFVKQLKPSKHKYVHHWYGGSVSDWFNFCDIKPFIIYIAVLNNGRCHILNVNLYDNILKIKRRIFEIEGVPPPLQRLQFNNQTLQDNLTLYQYKINENSQLYVSVLTMDPFLNILQT